MKLFTKEIDKKLAAQYHLGADLNAQVVVAKIFNPYGNGRWYLINSDPADPDYLWAIVQIGNIVEIGSVSRRELETLRVGRFGFPLERDLGFSQRNAQEVYNGVKGGKTYAEGGVADEVTNYAVGGLTPGRWYKDSEGVEYKFIGKVDSGPNKDQLLFTDGEKKMYKNIDDFGEKPKENKLFGWFAKGGEVLKKYGFETIDDAVKALKNGEISTTKFMDILYEYEKKSKRKLEDGGYMEKGGKLPIDERLANVAKINKILQDQYVGKNIEGFDVMAAPEPIGLYFKNKTNDVVVEPKHIWLDPTRDNYNFLTLNAYFDEADVNFDSDNMFQVKRIDFKDVEGSAEKIMEFFEDRLKHYAGYAPYKRKSTTKEEKIALDILENAWKAKGEESGITQAAYDKIKRKYWQGDKYIPRWLVIKYANSVKRDNQDLYKKGERDYMTEDEVLQAIADAFKLSVDGKDDTRLAILATHFGSKQDQELQRYIDGEVNNRYYLGLPPDLRGQAEELYNRLLPEAIEKMAEKNIPFVYLNNLTDYKYVEDDYADGGMVNIGTIKDDEVYFDKQSGAFSIRVIDGLGNRVNKLNVNTIDDLLNDYPKFRLNENGKKEFKDVMADGGKLNYNDPVIMAIRAKKDAAKPMVTKPNPNQAQIAMLLKKKARIEKDMEQEAELEGGPKADEYAAKLEQIDNAIKKLRAKKMAMGGKTKFADKVKSIQSSLLKRKKVAPSVQKDYGKTYNKSEAKESATRIVGAMTAKERLMAKKKMADGGLVSMQPEYKKLIQLEEKARNSAYRAKDWMKWSESTGDNYRQKWEKMVLKLRGWNSYSLYEDKKSKPEWVQFCKETNKIEDYDFGDVLA